MRTDLAHEIASRKALKSGLTLEQAAIGGVEVTRIRINRQASEKTGKPVGTYVTLFCPEKQTAAETAALARIISEMLPVHESGGSEMVALVTGLGNENITPDSLGVRAAGKVLATAHLSGYSEFDQLNIRKVYVVQPGVMAQTGMESAAQLKLIAGGITPDCLIVIDSLACGERERLGTTIQVTDAGISPGSGVKNERKEFSRRAFGVPVIAIGVPTVIDWSLGESDSPETLMLVPRDIDLVISHFSKVISGAINRALNPDLDESEIEQLLV